MIHRITGRRSKRAIAPLVLGAALLVPALGAGQAQAAALPTLTLNITGSGVTVGGSPQSGAVNVVSTASGLKEVSAILLKLNPGVSASEATAFLASKSAKDPNNVGRYGVIDFDAAVAAASRAKPRPRSCPASTWRSRSWAKAK